MNTLTKKQIDQLPAPELKDLAKRGILQLMKTDHINLKQLKYTDLPQYKKHARFKGIKISVSEASREFNIPHPTISRWATKGYITILEKTDREIYLDKADMAYCSEIYHERNGRRGRWLFNDDRTPYIPLTRQAS